MFIRKAALAAALLSMAALPAGAATYSISSISTPAADSTGVAVYDVTNAGAVLGTYTDAASGNQVSFLDQGGLFTPIVVPGSLTGSSVATAISGNGQYLAGVYQSQDGTFRSFIETGGVFSDLPSEPAAVGGFFNVAGINDSGEIAGNYFDGATQHAATLVGGVYTTIDDPASSFTHAEGLNDEVTLLASYGAAKVLNIPAAHTR